MSSTKRRPEPKKRQPREDFNEAAFRIVQQATREKPTKRKPPSR